MIYFFTNVLRKESKQTQVNTWDSQRLKLTAKEKFFRFKMFVTLNLSTLPGLEITDGHHYGGETSQSIFSLDL